jgi:ethanolamine utilization microcompartment shell protein EutL
VKIVAPPTETNFACAWLTGEAPGDLGACRAAAAAYLEAVLDVVARPR